MREQLNVTELDYQTIKENLISHFVNDEGKFTDWDFEGSNLNTLLDVLAYNTHYNAMHAHMAVNESFIDSAQLRSSVTSAAKLLSYTPRSYSAAKALLNGVFVAESNGPETFTLERGTRFVTTSAASGSYEFVVLDDIIQMQKSADGTTYINNPDTPICAYEGRLVTRNHTANLTYDGYRYIIPDLEIDTNSLKVIVYPTAAKQPGSGVIFRKYSNTDINIDGDDPVYFIFENSFGQYEISFGNGIYGKKLEAQNVIELEYLVCSGSQPNGIRSSFKLQSRVPLESSIGSSYGRSYFKSTKSLLLVDRISGGAGKETLERVKQNAIYNFISQNRSVTAEDYKHIIRSEFPFIQSISVWGGENNIPPEYGKVFISARPYDSERTGGTTTAADKRSIINFLQNKRILAIQPTIVDPAYVTIVLDILFKYDPNILRGSLSSLEKNIRIDLIKDYNENVLNTFDTIFRHSAFQKRLDNYDSSILNSLVRVFVINTTPAIFDITSIKTETIIDFGTPLVVDDGAAIVETKTNAIWKENGIPIFLADEPGDGPFSRNLYIFKINDRDEKIKIRNVGTLDLAKGIITFDNSIYSDEYLELQIVCIPKSNDIVGARNLLVSIDEELTSISGSIDEVAAGGNSQTSRYTTFDRDR